MMTRIWLLMVTAAVGCGLWNGRGAQVAAAAMEGAQGAVELCFSIAGMLCLWSGVMEVMRRSGLARRLARLLEPVLRRLYRDSDSPTREDIAANVSANLLGLGNAATPLGLKAMARMAQRSPGRASDDMCMLAVCNAASLQLIPTTVAAVRQAAGCATPFDILPAVWLTSLIALGVGVGLCLVLRRGWKE